MRALYVSAAVGDAGRSLAPLAEILGQSDRNNRRDHVSGVLARHEGLFLQAIEGARIDLDRLLERLRRDPRHDDVRLLAYGPASERAFAAWGMALADVSSDPALANGRRLDELTPDDALAILKRAATRIPVAA
ncbi:MAG: BLUF domain-containing protein [Brevundimonas sp.]